MEAAHYILDESSPVTNVTMVCSDGIIHTHKIIVASVSDFMKHLLSDIPVGDEITLFLPDHGKCSIIDLLNGVFSSNNSGSSKDSTEFGFTSLSEPVSIKVHNIKFCPEQAD